MTEKIALKRRVGLEARRRVGDSGSLRPANPAIRVHPNGQRTSAGEAGLREERGTRDRANSLNASSAFVSSVMASQGGLLPAHSPAPFETQVLDLAAQEERLRLLGG